MKVKNFPKHNFIKCKEDFTCEKCGAKVKGTGYTNHCPNCLFGKHVDKDTPGDRKGTCKGLMEPVNLNFKNGKYSILHRCLKCGKLNKNKIEENDNFEKILELCKNK